MKSKRTRNLILLFLTIVAVIAVTSVFLLFYLDYGSYSEKNSLFYLLSSIDYLYLVQTFSSVMLIMLVLDSLIIMIRYFWKEFDNKDSDPIHITMPTKVTIAKYWGGHRTIHLTFILLTIFLTIAIAAPLKLMNTFTAIVSISVLISNLTKKDKV